MSEEATKAPPIHLPLSAMYLCVNCEMVTNAAKVCPACASRSLLSLGRVLSGSAQPELSTLRLIPQ
jgi:hypothetical protein